MTDTIGSKTLNTINGQIPVIVVTDTEYGKLIGVFTTHNTKKMRESLLTLNISEDIDKRLEYQEDIKSLITEVGTFTKNMTLEDFESKWQIRIEITYLDVVKSHNNMATIGD